MADSSDAHGNPPLPRRQHPAKQKRAVGYRWIRRLFFPVTSGPLLARYLLATRDVFEVEDRKLTRLGMARSTVGILATAVAGYFFHRHELGIAFGADNAFIQFLDSLLGVYLAGGIALVIGVLFLVFRQRAGKRRHLLTPLFTYVLAWIPLLLPVILFAIFLLLLPTKYPLLAVLFVPYLFLLIFFIIPWWIIFFATCCFYLTRDTFRAADANPLLAPVLSTLVPLIPFVTGLVTSDDSTLAVIPNWAGTLMALLGVLSTGTLSAIEIHRLRRDHGITPTTAPPATETQRSARAAPRETPREEVPPYGPSTTPPKTAPPPGGARSAGPWRPPPPQRQPPPQQPDASESLPTKRADGKPPQP